MHISPEQQIIVAQATPIGSGAIALIRLSGKECRKLISHISRLSSEKTLIDAVNKSIQHGYIIDAEQAIVDEVLFLIMDGPRSFTGEDTLEITCHNNQFIIQKIIELVCKQGARIAERGEFTRRAVLNKRIDITQAEAINDLIHANNELAIKKALEQLQGSLSEKIKHLDDQLSLIAAWTQASFEFLDEERDFTDTIKEKINTLINYVTLLIETHEKQKIIRNGIRIALIGTVNAGKSSLFNSLIKQNRAIVTAIPGTTRDIIEYGIYHHGTYITYVDTAGIRETDDIIEQEGIKRSLEEINNADIVLIITDSSEKHSESIRKWYVDIYNKSLEKAITIANKNDLGKNIIFNESIQTSSHTKKNIDLIIKKINEKIEHLTQLTDFPFMINARHVDILHTVKEKLYIIEKLISVDTIYYEIVLLHIHETQQIISHMTGKSIEEKSLDRVFKEFCVGK
jgi:tRNA modification GTPase